METKVKSKDRYNAISSSRLPLVFDIEGNNQVVIEEFHSRGGFSFTYKGKFRTLSKTGGLQEEEVIIKEFFLQCDDNIEFCTRDEDGVRLKITPNPLYEKDVKKWIKKFQSESQIIYENSHPYIVSVRCRFDANNTSYYVMESIKGCSLEQYIIKYGKAFGENRCFGSYDDAWKYMRQICEAIQSVHAHKMLHLDISPRNIMVEFTIENNKPMINRFVLIDFGNSRLFDLEGIVIQKSSILAYSYGFAALEVIAYDHLKEKPRETADIYSLAAVLCYMLTGNTPNGTNFATLDLPEEIKNFIQFSTNKESSKRPQSVEEFIRQGDALLPPPKPQILMDPSPVERLQNRNKEVKSPLPPVPPEDTFWNKTKKKLSIVFGGFLLLVALWGGYHWWLTSDTADSPQSKKPDPIVVQSVEVTAEKVQQAFADYAQQKLSEDDLLKLFTPNAKYIIDIEGIKFEGEDQTVEALLFPSCNTKVGEGYIVSNVVEEESSKLIKSLYITSIYDVLAKRKLTDADVRGISKDELRIMRNYIYARRGYRFSKNDLSKHFAQYDWYTPRTNDMQAVFDAMTEVEQYNVKFIKGYE